MVSGDDKMSYE